MFLDLERLSAQGEAVDRTLPAAGLSIDGEEFRLASDVEIKGRIQRVSADSAVSNDLGSYRLEGTMSCRIEVPCVRCLEPFLMDVDEELDLLYVPQRDNVTPDETQSPRRDGRDGGSGREAPLEDRGLEADELATSFYQDDRIDLAQMVLEQIVLALPMKPLCKADCRGLCPECGVNRNTTSCACATDETDPRWAPLKTLLDR